MYYHTLANQTKNRRDIVWVNGTFNYEAQRSWFWFPLFSFFESDIDCKIPNEFQWPMTLQVKKKLNNTKQSPLANTNFFIYLKKNFFQDVRNMYDFYLSQLQKTNKENPPRSNSDKNFNKKKSKIK